MIRNALFVLVAMATQPVLAHPDGETAHTKVDQQIVAPPPTYKANNVNVVEKLGAKVPLDARFRDQRGQIVTLGQVIGSGELPTILTFNYSDCPMLCNLQLNGLTAALPALASPSKRSPVLARGAELDKLAFKIGTQFRIVTIDLEPKESLVKLVAMRERYVARLPEADRDAARAGWTFLVAEHPGDANGIRRVADAVGFSYTYIPDRAEWAHPAALIFLSARGMVTRYVFGIEFEPAAMRESIIKAGTSEPATAIGFMNRCYHYDPDANNHSRAGVMALRLGAAGFVVLLLSGLGVLHLLRRSRPGVNRS